MILDALVERRPAAFARCRAQAQSAEQGSAEKLPQLVFGPRSSVETRA